MLKFYNDGAHDDFDLAECKKYDPEIFFPEPIAENESVSDPWGLARKICEKCPIKDKCLTYAIKHREHTGMWGGKTPRERGKIKIWERASV